MRKAFTLLSFGDSMPRAARFGLLAPACLASWLWADSARAQAPVKEATDRPAAGTSAQEIADKEPQQPPIDADEKRPVPNYDGREPEPTDAGDVLIWVPRLALSPLYLVSEYGLRRPLGWLVTTAERNKWPAILVDFFTFGPERKAGLIPTALFDFGFKPSVGLYFFWDDFLVDDNYLRARASTWGPDWLRFSIADRYEVYPGHEIGVRADYLKRPDWVFYGLGPKSQEDDLARFSATRMEAGFTYRAGLWRSSSIDAFVGVRTTDFDADTGCCSDRTVADRIEQGRLTEPPGMRDGYTVLQQGLSATLDTRPVRNAVRTKQSDDYVTPPGSGVRLNLRGVHSASLTRHQPFADSPATRYEWINYGASLSGFVDLTGQQRVLGLSLITDFSDPLTDELPGGIAPIPFTEQVSLGGDRPLRGFLQGRLIDRSAAVAVLEYQWPVWVFLDGAMFYSAGNVFGEHLDGFSAELLRQSFGLGLRSNDARDHPFEILLAFGSEPFEEGGEIESVRFVFGTTAGF